MFKIKDFDKIDKITHSNISQLIWFGYVLRLSKISAIPLKLPVFSD